MKTHEIDRLYTVSSPLFGGLPRKPMKWQGK